MHSEEMQSALYQALDMMNARNVREFAVPPTTFMGPGAVSRCGEALRERGIQRPFVMVDGMLHHAGMTDVLERNLKHSGIEYEIWPCLPGEPVDSDIGAAVEQISLCQCDGVVALGGGSVLDSAKVVAVIATNPALALENLVAGAALNRRLPFIAIPTTSGTGSEATNVAVITAANTHRKQVLVHAMLIPDLAIIDACLTLGVPPHITAATGIDALTHAIEAYVASNGTPLTRGLAYRAIHSIGQALPQAVGQGQNLAAREAMMLASYMAGMAFSNAGLGLCHATAHQIGAAYGIPHGKANAIMLPSVMRFNQLVCKTAYGEIGHALTGKSCAASETIAFVEHFINELDPGIGLRAAGGCETDFANFAHAALSDICITTNPRTVTEAQIITLYQDA
ncbi:iron-containing alcohol dehydrogenase [Buttiauxella sp. B2]|uniref:iron-containing alcohol dehydrogenase n=1 Tax=Buttiauxella sp. B2 TaxID=2587812 RepID=UPI0011226052|nr:iron-containing alcohol dehydrogenase [Buttiauxella sp. B2]TNV22176.1 iron-containing alcohol dehydrogenase [Buttiauxella sp. B2]